MKEKSKEIKMEGKQEKSEKFTYEQLEQIAANLQREYQQLYSKYIGAQNTIAEFNEIGILLEILAKSEHFSEGFVTRCSGKIEEIVTKALDDAEEQDKKETSDN